jgi:hypothetical protein
MKMFSYDIYQLPEKIINQSRAFLKKKLKRVTHIF